jgi:6-phosphogluconolactonase
MWGNYMNQMLYLGTQEGIDGILFHEGQFTYVHSSVGFKNTSYLLVDEENKFLYAVTEMVEGDESCGGVASFRIDATGALTLINTVKVEGKRPCHLCLSPKKQFLYTASYHEGMIIVFPIHDGVIGEPIQMVKHEGSGPRLDRQSQPHVHYLTFLKDQKTCCAVDLGTDSMVLYEMDDKTGLIKMINQINVSPGVGPRHLVLHPTLDCLYLINELESTIFVYQIKHHRDLEKIQSVSTLMEETNVVNYPSAIRITKDGKYLYASNRGMNCIAIFAVDEKTGQLSMMKTIDCGGLWPRDFNLDLNDDYLLVCNQHSDLIMSFQINKKGFLTKSNTLKTKKGPVSIVSYQMEK